jgi:hypothetical protein
LEERTQKIHGEADKLVKQRKAIDPISYRPLGPGEAVVIYADRFLSGWMAAAAIDILPVLLVLPPVSAPEAIRADAVKASGRTAASAPALAAGECLNPVNWTALSGK